MKKIVSSRQKTESSRNKKRNNLWHTAFLPALARRFLRTTHYLLPTAFCLLLTIFFSSPAYAMGRKPKVVPIEVKVDFGPANKPGYSGTLNIEKGTTPKEAVSQVFPVLSGFACCSLREIIAIDGVKIDPAKNHWWTVSVNGSKKVKPNRTKLKKGDVLEWKYIQEAQ